MNPWMLYAFSAVAVFVIALGSLFSHRAAIGKIIAANLTGSGLFLLFVAIARRAPDGIPDPVVQALVLTSIVVSVSATALALALLRRIAEAGGAGHAQTREPEAEPEERGAR